MPDQADSGEFNPQVLARLAGLESEGRPLVDVLYEELRRSTPADLARLAAADARDDADEVVRLAHALKSSVRQLGLARMGDACESLEAGVLKRDARSKLVADLVELYARGCAWLGTMVSDPG